MPVMWYNLNIPYNVARVGKLDDRRIVDEEILFGIRRTSPIDVTNNRRLRREKVDFHSIL